MDDLSFYDSQLQYQNRVGAIEKERLKLEREMFAMMKSDKRLQKLRAAKLRSYWQQVCEREKRARERNEDLLQDFQNLEMKIAAMEAKSKKLRAMKMEYDEKVKQMYPKWRQEVEIARAKKQLQERSAGFEPSVYAKTQSPAKTASPQVAKPSPEKFSPRQNDPSQSSKSLSFSVATPITSPSKSVNSPSKAPITSTPESTARENLLPIQQVQPPPDSFADTNLQESQVSSKSPIASPSKSVSVVHTIPTALSPQEDGGFSDSSFASDHIGKDSEPIHISSHSAIAMSPSQHSRSKVKNQQLSPMHSDHPTVLAHQQGHQASPPIKESSVKSFSSNSIGNPPAPSAAKVGTTKPSSPELRPSSKLSISSFGSDDLSPRLNMSPRSGNVPLASDQSLRASATYQAILKQHSRAYQDSLKIPNMDEVSDEDDQDDLEDLLSPHGTGKVRDEEEHSHSSRTDPSESQMVKQGGPVYIPTAMMSTGSSTIPRDQPKSRSVPRAPWESDSEEEYGLGETNLSHTGESSKWDQKLQKYDPVDDYDFYD